MLDLSDKLTVFLLSSQNNINLPNVMEGLKNQSVTFKFEVIENIKPLASALQEMIIRCKTPYYIQCDEDMVLNSEAINTMYNSIKSNNEFFCRVFPLMENSINQNIYGIKIFNHDVMSRYSYNLESEFSNVDLFQRMERDVFKFKNEQTVVGLHSPLWTPESIYNRYYLLSKKIKLYTEDGGYGDLHKKFKQKLSQEYNPLDFWAMMGVLTAKYSSHHISYQELSDLFIPKVDSKKLRIGKVIDQFGWAFYFIAKEMAKYSNHDITYEKYNNVHYDKLDVLLLSNPNICIPTSNIKIPTVAKESGLKVIGQYCGEVQETYKFADLIITISPQTFNFAKSKYTCPVIYLPESIDTSFFKVKEFNPNTFVVGWAGREHVVKRTHILDKLDFKVKKQAAWGAKYFNEEANAQPMLEFYHSIDCLILTSASECQPRVIMEAMSCGLPVISTDVGSVSMMLDKEWIVPTIPEHKTIEGINRKLKLLAENPELRKNVGKRNRIFIHKNFSWAMNQKYWDKVFTYLYDNEIDKIKEIHNSFTKKYWRAFSKKPKYVYDRISNTFLNAIKEPAKSIDIPKNNVSTLEDKLQTLKIANVKFWGLKKTCLYMVNGIHSCPEPITIGVKTEEDKKKILNVMPAGIDIIINPNQQVKIWKENIYVPLPVVPYLTNMFGEKWKSLTS
jgi:glycosyltransferase involved in cell wall biosynthesis